MKTTALPRVVLHVDMDAFYAAIEVRENPALAGKPVIVGHRGRRGVVSTCSYEARRFGVRSAMPAVTAERLCPQAVWLPGRMSLYAEVSSAVRLILATFSPRIEPLSIDEAFVDLTGIAADLEAGRATAARIKARIAGEQRLTASVGIAPNKFLAKVASDLEKPDGLTVLPAERVEAVLWPLGVERLWGVGPRTAERLRSAGLSTIGDLLRRVDAAGLASLVGEGQATHLRRLARGEDDRPVETERVAKSASEERTYRDDLTREADIDRALLARAEGVARQLRLQGLAGRTVHLKVRTADYTTWTRSITLPESTDLAEPLLAAARTLLRDRVELRGRGVRLLGLSVSGLHPAGAGQSSLFRDPVEDRARRVARAADEVRDRLGERSLVRARLVGRPRDRAPDGEEPCAATSLPSVD